MQSIANDLAIEARGSKAVFESKRLDLQVLVEINLKRDQDTAGRVLVIVGGIRVLISVRLSDAEVSGIRAHAGIFDARVLTTPKVIFAERHQIFRDVEWF